MGDDPYIGNFLRLSTANHPPGNPPPTGDHRTTVTEYGMVVWPLGLEDVETPDWLRPIVEYANANRCGIIEFDRDNEPHERFQVYEW